jgi:ribosomal-protein-alanine N-acetyltransferase
MRLADLDEVMEIERRSYKTPWTRQIFIEELGRDFGRLDVVRERHGGKVRVVAYCNSWNVRDEVHILNVAVHPDARRRGHAALLLAHVIRGARARHCRCITLEVRRSNHGAIQLYRSFGFRGIGIRARYYAEDNEDAVVMLLDVMPG